MLHTAVNTAAAIVGDGDAAAIVCILTVLVAEDDCRHTIRTTLKIPSAARPPALFGVNQKNMRH